MNPFKDFDNYVENAMSSWHCPGAVVAVVKGDEVLHQGAYGLRDVEANLPMTLDTCSPIASVTKSFTAMCIALLVDENKLDWDTPIRDYAPEFILDDAYATQHMTIRDLLSHRTGLPGHFWATYRLDVELAELVRRMKYLKFNSSFRDKWQYNNALYMATAYLIEKLSNQTWQDFFHERIFSPLGMTASATSLNLLPKNRVVSKGYRVKRDDEGNFEALSNVPFETFRGDYPGTAGSILSTVPDLMTWLKLQLNKGKLDGDTFVTPENLREMHLPQMVLPVDEEAEKVFGASIAAYGMGWFIESYKGHTLISHSGELEGHTSWVAFIPKENIAVAVLTNLTKSPFAYVLTYESIDRALGITSGDWNSKLHEFVDPMFIKEAESRQESAKERISDASPNHPSEDYVGTYKVKGYPDFVVRVEGERLEACTVNSSDWSELRHYHYDTFEWYVPNYDFWMKLHFIGDGDGNIASVSLPFEPEVGDIVFEREAGDSSPT